MLEILISGVVVFCAETLIYFCGDTWQMQKKLLNISIVIYENVPQSVFALLDVCLHESAVNRLFVIDNSKQPHAALQMSGVEYIYNGGRNLGYGKAHNIALRQTMEQGVPFHLVVNPDVELQADSLSLLLEKMLSDERIGLLMPKVLSPDGEVQHLCKLLPTPSDLWLRRFAPQRYARCRRLRFEMRFADYDKEMIVPYLSGCFMLLRTDVLRRAGLFDERFFLYPEDVDLSRRMFLHGKNLYFPDVKIVHAHERASYKSVRLLSLHAWNMCKYFCKWGWLFDPERERINNCVLAKYKTSGL